MVKNAFWEQKERAARELESTAQAFRQSGAQMKEQDLLLVGQLANAVADQAERFSTYLHSRDVTDFLSEVKTFARRQPKLFLGGAVITGVLLTRLLKSSPTGPSAEQTAEPYAGETMSGLDVSPDDFGPTGESPVM